MISFIKNLFGFGGPDQETIREILTPPAPYKVEAPVNKVATPSETDVTVKAPKAAGKQRKPYYKNKAKAKPVAEQTNEANPPKAKAPAKKK